MNLAHCPGNSLLGLFPEKHAHFGSWSEHRAFHGHRICYQPFARSAAPTDFRDINGPAREQGEMVGRRKRLPTLQQSRNQKRQPR